MTDRDDGGYAFPAMHSIDGNWNTSPRSEYCGMSLRDYFAAKALPGVMAFKTELTKAGSTDHDASAAGHARLCYAIADAMLEERKK